MAAPKIRIKLRAYDHTVLDTAAPVVTGTVKPVVDQAAPVLDTTVKPVLETAAPVLGTIRSGRSVPDPEPPNARHLDTVVAPFQLAYRVVEPSAFADTASAGTVAVGCAAHGKR